MRFSIMLKTLGYFVLGCHALVLPTDSAELDIEIRIKSGAGNEVSSTWDVAFPVKHLDMKQHTMGAVPMGGGDQVIEITTQADWDKYNVRDRLVVLFVGASWATPSRLMLPTFARCSNTYLNAIFLYADIDTGNSINVVRGVSTIPTFLYYKDFDKVDTITGFQPQLVEDAIKKHY